MDKRSITSAANGKKGGRPKGFSAIQAEKTREYVARQIKKYEKPLIKAMIDEVIDKHNVQAFKELMDRGLGKVKEHVDVTTDGDKIVFLPSELYGKRNTSSSSKSDR